MFDNIIRFVAGLFGFLLLAIGLRWLVDPSGSAEALGMPLLEGAGRSTQIGDLSAFFIFSGVFALLGVVLRDPALLLGPAVLMGLTAIFRVVATVAHDAAFMPDMIIPEVLMCIFFLLARHRIAAETQ